MDETTGPNQTPPNAAIDSNARLGLTQYKMVNRYPLDLGKDGLKNYTVFYINLRKRDSKVVRKRDADLMVRADETTQNRISPEAEQVAKNRKAIATLGAMMLGAQVGAMSVGTSGVMGKAITLTAAAAGAAIENTTNIVEKTVLGGIETTDFQTVQLQRVIALPLMSTPSATYKAEWQQVDTGIVGGLIRTGAITQAMDVIPNLLDAIKTGSTDSVKSVGASALQNPALLGSWSAMLSKHLSGNSIMGDGVGPAIDRSLARTANPFREQLFKSMGFRTFTFEYSFLPKSRREALEVKEIIDTFKYYMHPGLTSENFFLTYPAEFNIKYFYNGKENEFVHKIATCALTDLAVDYGSGNDFVVFRPNTTSGQATEYGIPTEISLRLQFTELELLTKDRVQDGY